MSGNLDGILRRVQVAEGKKYELAKLHCQLMATLMAPVLARELDEQRDRASWDGKGEVKLDYRPAAGMAEQVATAILKGHGLI